MECKSIIISFPFPLYDLTNLPFQDKDNQLLLKASWARKRVSILLISIFSLFKQNSFLKTYAPVIFTGEEISVKDHEKN